MKRLGRGPEGTRKSFGGIWRPLRWNSIRRRRQLIEFGRFAQVNRRQRDERTGGIHDSWVFTLLLKAPRCKSSFDWVIFYFVYDRIAIYCLRSLCHGKAQRIQEIHAHFLRSKTCDGLASHSASCSAFSELIRCTGSGDTAPALDGLALTPPMGSQLVYFQCKINEQVILSRERHW